MYTGTYGYPTNTAISSGVGSLVWTIISVILAIVGGILVYVLFVKKDAKTDSKFLDWLKRFLDFKNMIVEPILKVTYVIAAIFVTLYSFSLIGNSFVAFILMITLGNIGLRIVYEFSLIMIQIWKNTTEINDKTKK